MKKYILLGLLCAICTTSCLYKDLGNYDYTLLPQMKISGIQKSNGIKQQFRDILEINPQVSFGDAKMSDFDHAWYSREGNTFTLLSNEQNFVHPLVVKGLNNFRYKATHRETGLYVFYDTSCTVVSETERGWYFLKETPDGNTDMDAQFVTTEGTYVPINENIIKLQTGAPILGKPVGLDWGRYRYMKVTEEKSELVVITALFPTSTHDINVFDMGSTSIIARYEDLVDDTPPAERKIESLYSGGGGASQALIRNGGRLHMRMSSSSSRFFPEYIQEPYAMNKKPMAVSTGPQMWFFDNVSTSFLNIEATNTKFYRYKTDWGINATPTQKGAFPMTNTGCELMHFTRSEGKANPSVALPGAAHAIIRKVEYPDSVFLCHLETYFLNLGSFGINPMQACDTLQVGKHKLINADHISMHRDGGVLYFSSGAKISLYYTSLKSEVANVLDLSADSDQITWMKHLRTDYGNFDTRFEGLVVATYRAGKYQVRVFPIEAGGLPKSKPSHVFPGEGLYGEGKVVDGRFVSPDINPNHLYY